MRELSRATVTAASRIMLPAYAAFFAAVGASLLFTPQRRLRQTPVFDQADHVLDLDLWGCGYLTVAAALGWALLAHHRSGYRAALAVAAVWMSLWALVALVAAFQNHATFAAWAWPAFVAAACWASLVSLASGETREPR